MIVAIEIELNTVREKRAKGIKSYFPHKENNFSHHMAIMIFTIYKILYQSNIKVKFINEYFSKRF